MRYKAFLQVAAFAIASVAITPVLANTNTQSETEGIAHSIVQWTHTQVHQIQSDNEVFSQVEWVLNHHGGGDDDQGMHSERHIRVSVVGAKEVPAVQTNTVGHFRLDIEHDDDETTATYQLRVLNGEDVTMVHLHCAPKGKNGPAVVTLYHNPSGTDVHGTLSSGEIEDSDINTAATPGTNCPIAIDNLEDLEEAIDDGLIYVNVHTTDHPAGEVRGQL